MRSVLCISAMLGVAMGLTMAPAASAGNLPLSWGKADVSYAEYRRDAIECGHAAWYEDVSGTQAAAVFKRATSRLVNNEAGSPQDVLGTFIQSARIVESTRPELRFREVRTLQYGVLEKCLGERGYVRFQLTESQHRRLGKLRAGTPARHRYLYMLGSDPKVIDTQRI